MTWKFCDNCGEWVDGCEHTPLRDEFKNQIGAVLVDVDFQQIEPAYYCFSF